MAKVVCVLYDDPIDGYPLSYARDDLPGLERYPDGQILPTPKSIDFTPGALLGSASGQLGHRKYLEGLGHTLVVTSDQDGEGSTLDRELAQAEIVISQPFWPAYINADRIARSPKLKMAVTAGIGSDHIDLQAAMDRGIAVTEVTSRNSISVLECWCEGRPIRDEYLIVDRGKLAGVGAHSYSAGNATGGSEEAVKFKPA